MLPSHKTEPLQHKPVSSAKLITFEGGEGTGKSTQIRLAADLLRRQGIAVTLTREPGGSPSAEEIRNLLVTGDTERWSPLAETLLFYAARVEHWRQVIQPALHAGETVLCDRFSDSTKAYQVYAGGLPEHTFNAIHQACMTDIQPHLTLILDLTVAEGLRRARARNNNENRFENKGVQFHEKLREGFLTIAKDDPKRCVVVDASQSVEQVHGKIAEILQANLTRF